MNRARQARRKTQQQADTAASGEALWGDRARLILVPLDGSEEAKLALPVARLVGRLVGASIHVVHAMEEPLSSEELLSRVNLRRDETHGVIIDQVVGPPADAVVRLATEKRAMLIVMTTRGKTAYQGRTVRPVVEAIVHRAPCPVLLVRPELEQRVVKMSEVRRILLPLDGAPSSAAVIGPALNLAWGSESEMHLLYVATQAKSPGESGTLTTPRYLDQPHYEWPAWGREFLSRFGTCLGQWAPPKGTRVFLRKGEPAAEIVRFAGEQGSDLIVLEWQGRLDPEHAAVVRGVLENAPCPVLLLRTTSPVPS